METERDYPLLRNGFRGHLARNFAVLLIVVGVVLLAISGAYYVYAYKARSDLKDLNFSASAPPVSHVQSQVGNISEAAIISELDQDSGLEGFKPVNGKEAALPGTLSKPLQILIPAIGVDAKVTELQILDLGDSRTYETPKFTVGHIPETLNPGEKGASWLFGHLESPLTNEGSVFYRLPEVPMLLNRGETVHVILTSESGSYLYKVSSTQVVHESEISLFQTPGSTIQLVACVPRLVYDHRLIVGGELVGVRQ